MATEVDIPQIIHTAKKEGESGNLSSETLKLELNEFDKDETPNVEHTHKEIINTGESEDVQVETNINVDTANALVKTAEDQIFIEASSVPEGVFHDSQTQFDNEEKSTKTAEESIENSEEISKTANQIDKGKNLSQSDQIECEEDGNPVESENLGGEKQDQDFITEPKKTGEPEITSAIEWIKESNQLEENKIVDKVVEENVVESSNNENIQIQAADLVEEKEEHKAESQNQDPSDGVTTEENIVQVHEKFTDPEIHADESSIDVEMVNPKELPESTKVGESSHVGELQTLRNEKSGNSYLDTVDSFEGEIPAKETFVEDPNPSIVTKEAILTQEDFKVSSDENVEIEKPDVEVIEEIVASETKSTNETAEEATLTTREDQDTIKRVIEKSESDKECIPQSIEPKTEQEGSQEVQKTVDSDSNNEEIAIINLPSSASVEKTIQESFEGEERDVLESTKEIVNSDREFTGEDIKDGTESDATSVAISNETNEDVTHKSAVPEVYEEQKEEENLQKADDIITEEKEVPEGDKPQEYTSSVETQEEQLQNRDESTYLASADIEKGSENDIVIPEGEKLLKPEFEEKIEDQSPAVNVSTDACETSADIKDDDVLDQDHTASDFKSSLAEDLNIEKEVDELVVGGHIREIETSESEITSTVKDEEIDDNKSASENTEIEETAQTSRSSPSIAEESLGEEEKSIAASKDEVTNTDRELDMVENTSVPSVFEKETEEEIVHESEKITTGVTETTTPEELDSVDIKHDQVSEFDESTNVELLTPKISDETDIPAAKILRDFVLEQNPEEPHATSSSEHAVLTTKEVHDDEQHIPAGQTEEGVSESENREAGDVVEFSHTEQTENFDEEKLLNAEVEKDTPEDTLNETSNESYQTSVETEQASQEQEHSATNIETSIKEDAELYKESVELKAEETIQEIEVSENQDSVKTQEQPSSDFEQVTEEKTNEGVPLSDDIDDTATIPRDFNLGENKYTEILAEAKEGADESEEKPGDDIQQETYDTSPNVEDATAERSSVHTTEQNLEDSSAVLTDEHNYVTAEASDTVDESQKKVETSPVSTYAPSSADIIEDNLLQEQIEPQSPRDGTYLASLDTKENSINDEFDEEAKKPVVDAPNEAVDTSLEIESVTVEHVNPELTENPEVTTCNEEKTMSEAAEYEKNKSYSETDASKVTPADETSEHLVEKEIGEEILHEPDTVTTRVTEEAVPAESDYADVKDANVLESDENKNVEILTPEISDERAVPTGEIPRNFELEQDPKESYATSSSEHVVLTTEEVNDEEQPIPARHTEESVTESGNVELLKISETGDVAEFSNTEQVENFHDEKLLNVEVEKENPEDLVNKTLNEACHTSVETEQASEEHENSATNVQTRINEYEELHKEAETIEEVEVSESNYTSTVTEEKAESVETQEQPSSNFEPVIEEKSDEVVPLSDDIEVPAIIPREFDLGKNKNTEILTEEKEGADLSEEKPENEMKEETDKTSSIIEDEGEVVTADENNETETLVQPSSEFEPVAEEKSNEAVSLSDDIDDSSTVVLDENKSTEILTEAKEEANESEEKPDDVKEEETCDTSSIIEDEREVVTADRSSDYTTEQNLEDSSTDLLEEQNHATTEASETADEPQEKVETYPVCTYVPPAADTIEDKLPQKEIEPISPSDGAYLASPDTEDIETVTVEQDSELKENPEETKCEAAETDTLKVTPAAETSEDLLENTLPNVLEKDIGEDILHEPETITTEVPEAATLEELERSDIKHAQDSEFDMSKNVEIPTPEISDERDVSTCETSRDIVLEQDPKEPYATTVSNDVVLTTEVHDGEQQVPDQHTEESIHESGHVESLIIPEAGEVAEFSNAEQVEKFDNEKLLDVEAEKDTPEDPVNKTFNEAGSEETEQARQEQEHSATNVETGIKEDAELFTEAVELKAGETTKEVEVSETDCTTSVADEKKEYIETLEQPRSEFEPVVEEKTTEVVSLSDDIDAASTVVLDENKNTEILTEAKEEAIESEEKPDDVKEEETCDTSSIIEDDREVITADRSFVYTSEQNLEEHNHVTTEASETADEPQEKVETSPVSTYTPQEKEEVSKEVEEAKESVEEEVGNKMESPDQTPIGNLDNTDSTKSAETRDLQELENQSGEPELDVEKDEQKPVSIISSEMETSEEQIDDIVPMRTNHESADLEPSAQVDSRTEVDVEDQNVKALQETKTEEDIQEGGTETPFKVEPTLEPEILSRETEVSTDKLREDILTEEVSEATEKSEKVEEEINTEQQIKLESSEMLPEVIQIASLDENKQEQVLANKKSIEEEETSDATEAPNTGAIALSEEVKHLEGNESTINKEALNIPNVVEDAQAEEAAPKVLQEVEEICEDVSKEPAHEKLQANYVNTDIEEKNVDISESLKDGEKPDNTTRELTFDSRDITDDLNLKEQSISPNEEPSNIISEKQIATREIIPEEIKFNKNETELTGDKEKVEEFDEPKIHSTVSAYSDTKTQDQSNVSSHVNDSSIEITKSNKVDLVSDKDRLVKSNAEVQQVPEKQIIQESEDIKSANASAIEPGKTQTEETRQVDRSLLIEQREAKETTTPVEEENEDEHEHEHERVDSGSDGPVMVEASTDVIEKAVQGKKSHNILSGVGSKVKHSIAKVRKVITGKSSHPKPSSPK